MGTVHSGPLDPQPRARIRSLPQLKRYPTESIGSLIYGKDFMWSELTSDRWIPITARIPSPRSGVRRPDPAVSGLINGCLTLLGPGRAMRRTPLIPIYPKQDYGTTTTNSGKRASPMICDVNWRIRGKGRNPAVAQRWDEQLPTRQARITPRHDRRAPVNPPVTLAEARSM
jgi:hypothetical protein